MQPQLHNKVAEGGVYITHGAKVKRWCREGCSNGAVIRGVCVTHGAKVKRCTTRDVTIMPGMEEFDHSWRNEETLQL